jgi:hypothetical protein
MPGLDARSWAYHGDDGNLLLESSYRGHVSSSDFGGTGIFGKSDVVGGGLHVETGEGFCTRNSKKLNMGELPT